MRVPFAVAWRKAVAWPLPTAAVSVKGDELRQS